MIVLTSAFAKHCIYTETCYIADDTTLFERVQFVKNCIYTETCYIADDTTLFERVQFGGGCLECLSAGVEQKTGLVRSQGAPCLECRALEGRGVWNSDLNRLERRVVTLKCPRAW